VSYLSKYRYFIRLEPPESVPGLYIDYSEKRSLPITIPDYKHIQVAENLVLHVPW
jgi:hypothetical protein